MNKNNRNRTIVVKIPRMETKSKLQKILDVGNLVVLFATIASLILNYCTLCEMQEERNSAYRPDIQFSSVEYVFQINDYMALLPEVAECPVYQADENRNADNDFFLNLNTRNIGVGTAKNVKISISEESSFNAIAEFNEMSVFCDMEYGKGPHGYWMKFSDNSYADLFWLDDSVEISYILPNAEDVHQYKLPSVYYCLINAMRIEAIHALDDPFERGLMIPDIEITIEYPDVQGVLYQEKAYIHTEPGWAFSGGRSLVVSIISEDKVNNLSKEVNENTTQHTPNNETIPATTSESYG